MTTNALPSTSPAVPYSAATPAGAGENEALHPMLDCYDQLLPRDLAFELVQNALDVVLGRVDDMLSHESLFTAQPALAVATISELLTGLTYTVTRHPEPDCSALRPPAVIRRLGDVFCAGCLPRADIRTALRQAVHPTKFDTDRMNDDPEHWLHVLAITVAACLAHAPDPDRMLTLLDDLA
jgi:hypothetical protein